MMRPGKRLPLLLIALCLILTVFSAPALAETAGESSGAAGENTIPTTVLWTNHPDANVRIDNSGRSIRLTGKLDTENHLPAAFTYDAEYNAPKSDFKDDRFSFDFTLRDWKMNGEAIDSTAYLVFSFRVSEASMAPWSASFGIFLLFFPDMVQFRINDGSPDENEAYYLYLHDVSVFDGESHHVDIRVDDETYGVTVQIDGREDWTLSHVADEDPAVADKFDADGGNMFMAHYVTAEISDITFINSKEAPAEDPGGLLPGGTEDNETQMRAPNPARPEQDTWKIILVIAAGAVALGLIGFGYVRVLKKR